MPGNRLSWIQFMHNQCQPTIRCSVSPIPCATTSYNSKEEEEPAEELSEDIQEPEEQVVTDIEEPGPNNNKMETDTDANRMENAPQDRGLSYHLRYKAWLVSYVDLSQFIQDWGQLLFYHLDLLFINLLCSVSDCQYMSTRPGMGNRQNEWNTVMWKVSSLESRFYFSRPAWPRVWITYPFLDLFLTSKPEKNCFGFLTHVLVAQILSIGISYNSHGWGERTRQIEKCQCTN